MMRRAPFILLLTLLSALPTGAHARGIRTVDVVGPRIVLGDILPKLSGEVAEIDLGPVPRPNGSTLLRGDDIQAAIDEAGFTGVSGVPEAVRVRRAMTKLSDDDLKEMVKTNLKVKSGVTLKSIRPPRTIRVPAGHDTVDVTLPKMPRREGVWVTSATVNLYAGADRIARISVPVTFEVSEEAAQPDVKKGAKLILVVKSGQIEVRIRATAGAAADVGDKLPVTLRPSGRVVQARLLRKDRAIAL